MNELSTIEGLPGWEALPAEERLKVRKLHAACREIAAAPNKMAAYKLAAQAMKDAGHPMSWQSVQRKFLAWQTSGSLLALADLRMAGMRPTRARVKHPGFVAYWAELQTRCQRNGGQAYPLLLDIWRKKSEVIPGYEGWPGHPQIPVGWSKKNLMRIKPAALEARVMREGVKAAAPLLPMVLTTRVGMEAGEYYVSDDNWVDAHVICGKQIVRPLQLGCLDIATGKMVHWGMMPRMMRQDGTHAGLTERYMRMFVAGLLANVGINTSRGTTLVVENGTAAIRAHMEQVLLDLFDGAVKVHRSGMEGKTQALLRGYEGRQGGNPRGKAHLESVWNLTANIWSSCLPAPSGHDRTEPEWLAGLMKEQKALLKKLVRPLTAGRWCKTVGSTVWYLDVVPAQTPIVSGGANLLNFQFKLKAAFPYWRTEDTARMLLGGMEPAWFPTPVSTAGNFAISRYKHNMYTNFVNDGNAETAFTLYLQAAAKVKNPMLWNNGTRTFIRLNTTMQAHERAVICTADGNRGCRYYTADGAEDNGFRLLDIDSDLWMMLTPGDNVLRMTADEGNENLTAIVTAPKGVASGV